MCLERADLVKKKVTKMGGQVGKPTHKVLTASKGRGENGKGEDDAVQLAMERRTRQDEADQISILRRSSTIQGHSLLSTPSTTTGKTLHLPLWHDADATFLAPLPASQLDQMIIQPHLSPDQEAAHATWENIYNSSNTFTEFRPSLQTNDGRASTGSVKLEQGIGANCSVIAGLNALVAHNARWGTTLGVRNFVPIAVRRRKGDEEDQDQTAEVRCWRVKVFVNGAWRGVSPLQRQSSGC